MTGPLPQRLRALVRQPITGSSGSGVVPSAGTHHPVRAVNLKSYKPLDHQHTPEIEETLRAAAGERGGSIELRFLRPLPLEYPQFGRPFVPWLSILDVLMFNELDTVRAWLDSHYELT